MIRAIILAAHRPGRRAAATVAAVLLLAGCASTNTTTGSTPVVCLTSAPGGKLCGSDAASFCQEMKTGQTVDPLSVDATTRRRCAALGVPGLR